VEQQKDYSILHILQKVVYLNLLAVVSIVPVVAA
jgi:hypothetical protein